jgi:hypothetical protein
LCVIFALLDPDPDPTTQINADPCCNNTGFRLLYREEGLHKVLKEEKAALKRMVGSLEHYTRLARKPCKELDISYDELSCSLPPRQV